MRRAVLFALLLASCKDDPSQSSNCTGDEPDFDVVISASDGPLPPDTVVLVEYGAGTDEYRLAGPDGKDTALFCSPSDREGNPTEGGGQGGESGVDAGGAGGGGGTGGHGRPEALHCELWTDGPARLTVTTLHYPVVETDLEAKRGKCTVPYEIELVPADAGT